MIGCVCSFGANCKLKAETLRLGDMTGDCRMTAGGLCIGYKRTNGRVWMGWDGMVPHLSRCEAFQPWFEEEENKESQLEK